MKTILWFINKYADDDISAHSAQVSFFVMVSLFPLLLFLLTLIHYTPITEEMIADGIGAVVPASLNGLLNSWITEIFQNSSHTLLSISILSALWAGSKGFMGIIAGIQKIHNIRDNRNFFHIRLLAIIYTIGLSLLLILSMVVLVYGNQIFLLIEQHIFQNKWSISNLFSFRVLIGISLFILFFLFLYVVLPNRKVTIRSQIPGAFIASILWVGFSFLYSVYIDYFAHPASLYGSLAYIVLFMLWLFVCTNIIFIGCILNVYIEQNPGTFSIKKLWRSPHNSASK